MKKYILGFVTAMILFTVYAFNVESRIGDLSNKFFIGSAYIKDTLTTSLVFSNNLYPKDSLLFKGQGNYAICDYQDNMLLRFRPGSSDIRFANNFDVIMSNLVTTDIINSGNTALTGYLSVGDTLGVRGVSRLDGDVNYLARQLATLSSVASAGTIVLPTNANDISGTTTITNITTTGWTNGSIVTLYFQGSLTLVNNNAGAGHTSLAGGVDFSATAGDVIQLMLRSSVWYEVSRSVN